LLFLVTFAAPVPAPVAEPEPVAGAVAKRTLKQARIVRGVPAKREEDSIYKPPKPKPSKKPPPY
jgi:hypothetical protein